MKVLGEPFENEKGRLYVKVKGVCPRCSGTGHYSYNPMDGDVCYECMGKKFITKTVRAYTEKEYTRMQAANERARAKREAEKEAKARDLVENAAKYKHEVALKLGFGEDEKAYLVYGDDTFAIKDKVLMNSITTIRRVNGQSLKRMLRLLYRGGQLNLKARLLLSIILELRKSGSVILLLKQIASAVLKVCMDILLYIHLLLEIMFLFG